MGVKRNPDRTGFGAPTVVAYRRNRGTFFLLVPDFSDDLTGLLALVDLAERAPVLLRACTLPSPLAE
jgi:hypothetical protein